MRLLLIRVSSPVAFSSSCHPESLRFPRPAGVSLEDVVPAPGGCPVGGAAPSDPVELGTQQRAGAFGLRVAGGCWLPGPGGAVSGGDPGAAAWAPEAWSGVTASPPACSAPALRRCPSAALGLFCPVPPPMPQGRRAAQGPPAAADAQWSRSLLGRLGPRRPPCCSCVACACALLGARGTVSAKPTHAASTASLHGERTGGRQRRRNAYWASSSLPLQANHKNQALRPAGCLGTPR